VFANTFCQSFVKKSLPKIHSKRVETLTRQVESLLNNAELTLTSLGRHQKGKAKVKSKIHMTWRFLRNQGVHEDMLTIYQGFASTYLNYFSQVRIAVDWSGCCSQENYLLRASLLYEGRSIPIYNEVHPAKKQENDKVHVEFLNKLAQIIPKGSRVIIVTDAGFKTPWFNKIMQLGWYFIGRVRGRIFCQIDTETKWQPVKSLHGRIKRGETKFLGSGRLGKTSKAQQEVNFIGYFGLPKGRKKPRKTARYPDAEKAYSSAHKEPWILVSNLDFDSLKTPFQKANIIRNIYKKRMQIEQNFRDDKNPRFGFGWRYSRTRDPKKINVLCLIASIATLILWLIGFAAEKQKLHYEFQANTIKQHRVLSYFFLGKEVIRHALDRLNISNLFECLELFRMDYPNQLGEFSE
jgi:hypothetical protein